MYHLRLKGTHYEMGFKRGTIFKKNNIHFNLNMDDFQMDHGIKSERILHQFFPEVIEEIRGVVDALEIDYNTFVSWMLAMGCCMYNLDQNTPEIRGCTALAFSIKDNIYYARNNDLPRFLKDGSKSEIYAPDKGLRFNITTSSFINGEEGINECGFLASMTFVSTNLEDIKPGFNSVFVIRYLLEKAHNVAEAKTLLSELPLASNANILVADKSGEMLVFECTPKKKNIRYPMTFKNGVKGIWTVNEFISKEMKQYERPTNTYFSSERYDVVFKALNDYDGSKEVEYLKNLLSGKMGFMCQYNDEAFDTIWSSVFDLKTLNIYRAEGNPQKNKFILDSRLCENYHFPKEIKDLIKGLPIKEIVSDISTSGDKIFSIGENYLKVSKNIDFLKKEMLMNDFLNGKLNVSKSLIFTVSKGKAYYLKTKVDGVSALENDLINDPYKLCDFFASAIKLFHSINTKDCPITIDENYHTLIHGDFCLPNVLISKSDIGFIDLGQAGVGDPWSDYAWAIWSLRYNLKTTEYDDYFLKKLNITFDEKKYKQYME